MVNIPASEIYPEASQGRLKTTDDASKSIREEDRIISKEIDDARTRYHDMDNRAFKYSDKLLGILKILVPLVFPLTFLQYVLAEYFFPIRVILFGVLFAIVGLLVISLILSLASKSARDKYKKTNGRTRTKRRKITPNRGYF